MTTGRKGTARCGTMSAYNAHLKRRETPCPACKAHQKDWGKARYLRFKSGYRLSMAEALAELGLPPNRIPAGVS